jgi:DNA-binding response OmpR family regulator
MNPSPPRLPPKDEVRLCGLVKDYLETMGYAMSVAHTGSSGLALALAGKFHAILLDVILPGIDGEEQDSIVALEMGADDYLPKTFSTRELLARPRAALRRSVTTEAATSDRRNMPLGIGGFYIDPGSHTASINSQPLILMRQEFDLLLSLLVENAECDFESFDRSVDAHILSLRKKLDDHAKSPCWIDTVRGVGHMLKQPGSE